MLIWSKTSLILGLSLSTLSLQAQDLEELVNENLETDTQEVLVSETYKSDRIINSISPEMISKKELDFKIDHHFGDISGIYGGYQNFYGLDNAADIRISFTYGITDRLNIGIGRLKGHGAQRGLIESTLKYALLQQSNRKPLSITTYGTFVIATNQRINNPISIADYQDFWQRTSAYGQVLLSRRFSEKFSLSAGLGVVYMARTYTFLENTQFASILGFRYKFGKRWGLIGDWHYNLYQPDITQFPPRRSPLAVGLEIETGGHVFHICFVNNRPLSEVQYIPYTTADWADGQFRWGFKISRIFNL